MGIIIRLFLVVAVSLVVVVEGEKLGTECASDFQSVMTCLGYAQGKQTTPSKECCGSIKDIKDNEPKCLCFIMQQTHNGSAAFKSMGIQESKLLQLPTSCQLHNASISFCPSLLGLAPNSPDAAIFTNATSSSASPTTTSSSSPTTTTTPLPQASAGGFPLLYGSSPHLLALSSLGFAFAFAPLYSLLAAAGPASL